MFLAKRARNKQITGIHLPSRIFKESYPPAMAIKELMKELVQLHLSTQLQN
jgi:hypothetical protein